MSTASLPATEPFRPQRMPLTELPVGAAGRICALSGEATVCARLREMGFCESAVVEKISGTGHATLLCQLCGTRIALSDRAGTHIVVEVINAAAAKHGR